MREAGGITIGILCLGLAGCADGVDVNVRAQVDTLEGDRLQVMNTGEPSWTSETAWRLEEDLRLGTVLGEDDPEQFGSIAAIGTDFQGRIYVLDVQAFEIRVFRSTGEFSHAIGGEGSGPGEFMFARSLSVGPGDLLVVRDDGTGRYSVFNPEGELVGTHQRSIVGTNFAIGDVVLSDGSYVDWAPTFPEGRFGSLMELLPIRYAAGFQQADTFPPLVNRWELLPSGMPQTYYTPSIIGTMGGDGAIWFAVSGEYQIHRRELSGDTTLTFSLPAKGVALGDSERETLRSTLANRNLLDEVLAALPERLPVVQGIRLDGEGHLMVLARVEPGGDAMVVDVFREEGFYLGRMDLPVTVPDPFRMRPIIHATNTHLYLVTRDEFDVEFLSRLRIVRPD